MSPEYLKTVIDRQFSEWMRVSLHRMVAGDEVCQVTLPVLEPSGDVVSVYVTESDGRILVHDGGHISGLLFESRRNGPTKHDRELVKHLLDQSGLKRDSKDGTVYVETDEDGLRFWLMELGWILALVPCLIPVSFPPEHGKRALGERTAKSVAQRLQEAGLDYAIERNKEMWGVSGRDWRTDFRYEVPDTALSRGKLVCILALDLDVPKPLKQADKTIAAALDLIGQPPTNSQYEYRVVYSIGNDTWANSPAARLLAAAGEHPRLTTYCWDDEEQQESFTDRVRQDLRACASSP